MKINNLRVKSAFLALAMTASMQLTNLNNVYAEENPSIVTIHRADDSITSEDYIESFTDNVSLDDEVDQTLSGTSEDVTNDLTEDELVLPEITNINHYYIYKVKRGDNASIISKKICKVYGVAKTGKYWPVIAYLNAYPRIIKENDELLYPSTLALADYILDYVHRTGWINRYTKLNNIYKKNKGEVTVGKVIDEIYGRGMSNNKEFFDAYMKIIGIDTVIDKNTVITNYDFYFMMTEYIPSIEEIESMSKKRK